MAVPSVCSSAETLKSTREKLRLSCMLVPFLL
jgi:hypothetical protein